MIRHSVHTGLGRGRPELSRLSEGIASSLRQFSVAQARCAAAADDNGKPSSSRQRSAAAASELLSMNDKKPRSRSPSNSKSASLPTPTTVSTPTPTPEIPKVINVNSLRGGFTGFRKFADNKEYSPGSSSGPSAGRGGIISGGIIRGGFRGRGGGSGKAPGAGFSATREDGRGRGSSRGAPGMRGRGRGGARGRGRGGDSDDRPKRLARLSAAEKSEENAYQKFLESSRDADLDVKAFLEEQETGVTRVFNPTSPKDLLAELADYVPAIAADSTLARSSSVLAQATILGSGRPYHPRDVPSAADAKERYQKGHGVFFPSAEVRDFVNKTTKNLTYQIPPKETQTAVLEAAVLGKYDAPKFADPNDTVGTIRSYVKRHGTWNAAAERSIEAKVKTLLPGAAAAAASAAAAAAAKARPAKAQANKA